MLAKIEEYSAADEVVKSVTILNAIRWVAQGWECVSQSTVQKCFKKAGILRSDFTVLKRASLLENDPFEDLDTESDSSDLQTLISQVQEDNACSVNEFINGDNELQTGIDFGDTWEDQFLDHISPKAPCTDLPWVASIDEAEDSGEEEEEVQQPTKSLEDVLCFFDSKGHTEEATRASQLLDSVNFLYIISRTKKQACITR